MQKYIALTRISNQAGDQVWLAGSLIELDDTKAAILFAAGAIGPLEGTVVPEPEPSPITIHMPESEAAPAVEVSDAPATETKRKRGE